MGCFFWGELFWWNLIVVGMFGWNFKLLKDWEIELAIEQCSRAPGGLFDKGDYTT